MQIGSYLKKLRAEKGLTIKELSDLTNLSVGFLSNTERDINSPSISSLNKICQALDIPMVHLFEDLQQESPVTKKSQRKVLVKSEASGALYELLSPYNRKLRPYLLTLEPGAYYGEEAISNPIDEFGFVIEGTLEIIVDDVAYVLEVGDSIYIWADQKQKFRNTGDCRCVSIWVSQGTDFGRKQRV